MFIPEPGENGSADLYTRSCSEVDEYGCSDVLVSIGHTKYILVYFITVRMSTLVFAKMIFVMRTLPVLEMGTLSHLRRRSRLVGCPCVLSKTKVVAVLLM